MGKTLETQMKYEITADASKATAAISNIDKLVNKISGTNTLGNVASSANKEWGSFDAIVGKVTNSLGSITIPAAGAVAAFAGIGAAAIGASKELFDLAKQGSDFGRSLASFESKTGLSAKAVSTLSLAAAQSGKDLNDLQRPFVTFNELLVKAQSGSDKAAASLRKMGVTDLKNLDTALDQVSKAFNETAGGQDKLHAAVEIFGKRGGPDFINVMAKMKGGFKEAQDAAEKLGFTLSERDVQAAKEFGLAYDTVAYQVKVATAKFALQYAPEITNAIKSISSWMSQNADQAVVWGQRVAIAISNIFSGFYKLKNWLVENSWMFRLGILAATGGASEAAIAAGGKIVDALDKSTAPGSRRTQGGEGGGGGFSIPTNYGDDSETGGKGGKIRPPKESDSEFRKFFADLGFSVNRTYGKAINPGSPHTYGGAADLSIRGKSIEQIFELMAASLEKGYRVFDERQPAPGVKQTGPHIHVENAKTTLSKSSRILDLGFTPEQLAYLQELDKERLGKTSEGKVQKFSEKASADQVKEFEDARKREVEIAKATSDQLITVYEQEQKAREAVGDYQAEIELVQKTAAEKRQAMDDELASMQRIADAQTDAAKKAQLQHQIDVKTIEFQTAKIKLDQDEAAAIGELNGKIEEQTNKYRAAQKSRKEYMDSMQPGIIPVPRPNQNPKDPEDGVLQTLNKQFEELHTRMLAVVGLKNVVAGFGQIAAGAFESLSQAVGSSIEQWALYGGSIGKALRQALAAELAHIAGIATVNALYATALGFMRLAMWDFVGAGNAFLSAGMWAALAGGTALAARAIAPRAATAAATGTQSATTTGQGTNNGGQVYSGQPNVVKESGRNTPGGWRPTITLNIRSNDSHIVEVVKGNVRTNGSLRTLILDTV